jgi:hypothetical protein
MGGEIYYTLLEVTGATKNDESIRPSASRRALTEKDRLNNTMVIKALRRQREGTFRGRNHIIFGRRPLRLDPTNTFPLPDLDNSGRAPGSLSMTSATSPP